MNGYATFHLVTFSDSQLPCSEEFMQKWEEIPENEKAFQLRLMEVQLTNKGMASVLTHKNC